MYRIVKINNCPEKTMINIKLTKLLSKLNYSENFIIVFILDYNIKQLQSIDNCIDTYDSNLRKKIKLAEFEINDNNSNGCDGRERLALVLSNIRSLKNSIKLINDVNDLNKICNVYTLDSKLKTEIW